MITVQLSSNDDRDFVEVERLEDGNVRLTSFSEDNTFTVEFDPNTARAIACGLRTAAGDPPPKASKWDRRVMGGLVVLGAITAVMTWPNSGFAMFTFGWGLAWFLAWGRAGGS